VVNFAAFSPAQQRPHVGDRGAHRVAGFAEHVPERDRAGRGLEREAEHLGALDHLGVVRAGLAQARQVALHVGQEHRHADRGERLRQRLQRDGLAGAGGAGDQAVAVGVLRQQVDVVLCLGEEQGFGHGGSGGSV
jgi:hypothetical protein